MVQPVGIVLLRRGRGSFAVFVVPGVRALIPVRGILIGKKPVRGDSQDGGKLRELRDLGIGLAGIT